jgi:hypothetical protein
MEMGPFFEENPWILIPVVIVIVEAWNAGKAAFRAMLRRSSADQVRPS